MSRVTLVITLFAAVFVLVSADYWKERDDLITQEDSLMLGSSIILSSKEELANKVLMEHKLIEHDTGFENPAKFAPANHFFQAYKSIEQSEVFKFIQKVPKGAVLHGHDTALLSEKLLFDFTYKENLYACTVNGRLKLHFFKDATQDKSCDWRLISALRQEDPNYNDWVKSQLTLYTDDPSDRYPTINCVWKAMMDIFDTVTPMITYKPVFQQYFYKALEESYEDNISYLEFRGTLPPVYELDGTTYGPLEVVGLYEEVIDDFKKDHPDFLGAKFIYAPHRKVDNSTIEDYVKIVTEINNKYHDLLAGFDLVGQEDLGHPLSHFIDQLQNIPRDIDFFFHSAETNWYGATTDLNLIDAILLGTKRIGHGYGLVKHPLIMQIVKEKQIAIEVCPISNQVLMLVEDMRNHPAAYLMSQGFPVVISYDDPSFWKVKGLSYDFYMAFMGIASKSADLKLLKQLAKNSLLYSSMSISEKSVALQHWEERWDKFIDDVIENQKQDYNKIIEELKY